jgi:hypothetical protein
LGSRPFCSAAELCRNVGKVGETEGIDEEEVINPSTNRRKDYGR